MTETVKEVLDFVKENDVKFIRLAFCDLFGRQKNISILADQLENAFEDGVSFDASSIQGFSDVTKSDLFLYPDPTTLTVMPWRPQQGRVIRFACDIKTANEEPYICDTRALLKKTADKIDKIGFNCKVSTECEFYLFKTDEDGNPTKKVYDEGEYLDILPLDKCENIRREICLCLDEMGLKPETSHHEQGPGQNEIDFKYNDLLTAADNFMNFKTVVKAVAARNGLFASFMPKPFEDKSGNGLHINISLFKGNENIFKRENNDKIANYFIEGILKRIREITLFLNPIYNSYERFGSFEAPKYISWSYENRSQLIRIPAAKKDKARMELRSPDLALNPYLAFVLLIEAGLEGINNACELRKPLDTNLYKAPSSLLKDLDKLPESLEEAVKLAKSSEFIERVLGKEISSKFIDSKEKEALDYKNSTEKSIFHNRYFKSI